MAHRFKHSAARRPHFLRQWREYRRLTQDQVSERIGLSKASLSKLENGKYPYTQDLLEALAELYGTDAASLISRSPEATEGIMAIWVSASEHDRRKILDVARVIVDQAESETSEPRPKLAAVPGGARATLPATSRGSKSATR